jgi:KDO2-lipid IV(A) lauroyltransferase
LDHDKQNSSKRQPGLKKGYPGISIEIQLKIIYVDRVRTVLIHSYHPMGKSSLKEMRNGLGDFFLNIVLTSFLPIFRRLPPKSLAYLAKIIGTIVFRLSKKYRERVIHNLSVAFGSEKDMDEIKMIAQEVFFHFTLTPLETVYLIANHLPFERFILKIKIKGKEYLEAALAKKKGVIALGAHLGAFTLLGSRLAVEGYSVNVMINQGSFPKLWKRLIAYQALLGQKIFPPKPITASIKKSLNCLHRNEVLYLVADEQQRRGGIPVPFFDQKAFTPSGPALFSLKTGAPILPMVVLRINRIQWTLVIGHPIEIERTTDEKKDIEALTAKFTEAIEHLIRQYPSQWTWLNRRWKSPGPKASLDMPNQEV